MKQGCQIWGGWGGGHPEFEVDSPVKASFWGTMESKNLLQILHVIRSTISKINNKLTV